MVHGIELGTRDADGARLALVRHPAGLVTPHHDHAEACLHVVLRGLYVEHSARGTVVACPGDLVLKEPGVEHWNRLGATGADSLRIQVREPDAPVVGGLAAGTSHALGEALALARALRGGPSTGPSTGVGRRRGAGHAPPELELLARLQRGFRDPIELGELARAIGVHRSHLARQFKREFGCSPQSWVSHKRCAYAAERLARGGETCAAIASEAGFADQSHMVRTFRRLFGTTPSRWVRRDAG